MEFNPANHIIQLCIQGMELEEKGKPEEARSIFLQAWNESTNDFEKFTSAYYVARHQERVRDKLKWLDIFAVRIKNKRRDCKRSFSFSVLEHCQML